MRSNVGVLRGRGFKHRTKYYRDLETKTEYNQFVKDRAQKLGRTEASVRSKLNQMKVTSKDNPQQRNDKIFKYLLQKKVIRK